MIAFFRNCLTNKIMAVIVATIILVLGIEIGIRLHFGTRDRTEIMAMYGNELAAATHAAFNYPMSVGDSEGIQRQLTGIKEKIGDIEVSICDFNQKVVYSTHPERLRTSASSIIRDPSSLAELDRIVKTGSPEKSAFTEKKGDSSFLYIVQPILNQENCYHCHGTSRKVLGGMILSMDADRTYAQVAAARNRTVLLGIISISVMLVIIYFMMARLIKRPVESLAEKARRLAEGDMSVSVKVESEDEIGVLGRTFNSMVESISSFSRKLEEEVARKTTLLNERTKLLKLLERANRELRELDKLKSTFLANMSHELRTPMNAIIGYTELMLDGIDGPINEEQEKSLHKVANNARHLLQLINDVLDISKIESGKIELHIEKLDLKSVIQATLSTFEPMISQKGLTLDLRFDEHLPEVYADEDKVGQILINLISNAVKFTHSGGITVTARASDRGITEEQRPLYVEVCVEDTGIGIRFEDLGKLFDKFTQLDISSTRQYEGTGLGLSIARGLTVLHKGVIWASSEPGKGSRFCFTLPTRRELLEKSAEPLLEPAMADGLAAYFNKPATLFLRRPHYAGKPLRCWEHFHCGQTSCAAYGSGELRCWLMPATHCKGTKVASYPDKVDFCKGCELIEMLILESDELQEMQLREVAIQPAVQSEGKTVLAVDDNPEAIEIIRKYLGEEYQVVGLLGGENALKIAKELKPAAITLDIMMPMKDGWQVLQELKNDPETQDIPVMILSIVDQKQRGFSLGAAEYIVKPVEKGVLLRKLRNLARLTKIKTVLVVDNEWDSVTMIGEMLTAEGYEVRKAYSGREAIAAMNDEPPDLVVLTLLMPEAGSIDVIEHIKSDETLRYVPVILVTQKDLSEEQLTELNGRISGILNKSTLTTDELLCRLRDTIRRCEKT